MKEFILKEEHLKLLKNANWDWNDSEFGAPEIDCKRPFGNSLGITTDIAEILGWSIFINKDHEKDLTEEQDFQARKIYNELEYAIKILMQTPGKEIPLGKYIFDGKAWKIA